MSGESEIAVYSWDTCVVLALLKNESDKPVPTIAAIAGQIQHGKAKLVVSTVMLAEILDVIEDRRLDADIDAFFRLPSVQVIDVNRRVARRAAELRWQWRSQRKNNKEHRNLQAPDAIILATAQLAEANHLHTFDPDLLKLDGNPVAGEIKICEPRFLNGQLLLTEQHDKSSDRHKMCLNGRCVALPHWGRPSSPAEFVPRSLISK